MRNKSSYTFPIAMMISLFLLFQLDISAQVILQLEIKYEVEAVKFVPGDLLIYKLKDSDWQEGEIVKIIQDGNAVLLDHDLVSVSDISEIMLWNRNAQTAGKLLTGFGAGWLTFGSLAHIVGKYDLSWSDAAVGAGAVGTGLLFSKAVAKRRFVIGKDGVLRIIDISYPKPTDN